MIGTGLDVWEICQMVEEFASVEELTAETQLSARHVQRALAYREHYPDEIEEAIADNRRSPEQWHELYPFVRRPAAAR